MENINREEALKKWRPTLEKLGISEHKMLDMAEYIEMHNRFSKLNYAPYTPKEDKIEELNAFDHLGLKINWPKDVSDSQK